MADRITTILDVQLDAVKVAEDLTELSRKIALVKNEQKQLDDEYKAGKVSATEYTAATAAMKDELTWLQKQQKGVIATQKLLTKDTETYSNTLNGQRQKLADMLKAYDQLDASFRDSRAGRKFLKEIKEQTEAVTKLEKATGRSQRLVGQYQEALEAAGVGIGGLTKKFKAFFANPWTILITAIITPLKALVDAFRSSEERTREMQNAFAPLKGAVDVVKQVFDQLAKSLSGLATGALKAVTDGVAWLFGAIDRLAKKVGLDWNLSKAFEDAAENSKKATEAERKYIDHRRKFVEQEARLENEIAKLRDKAVQKDKYTTDERVGFMEAAIEKERKIADEKVKLAKENLAYLEAEADRSENDAEMNDKLAEARAAVTRAETEYYKKAKELNASIVAFRKEELAATKAQENERKTAEREAEIELKKQQKQTKAALDYRLEVQMAALGEGKKLSMDAFEVQEKYYEDLLKIYAKDSVEYLTALKAKEGYEAEFAQKRKELTEEAETFIAQYSDEEKIADKYAAELRQLDEYHAAGILSEENYQATREEIDKKYAIQRVQRMNNATKQLAGMFGQIADMLGEYAEKNEDAAKAQKAFALSGIILNQAQSISEGALAIAKGVESAAGIPFPANIPAILSVVATIGSLIAGVASTIAQAKNLFAKADSGNFATGGVVGGTSYTGDKLVAHVNSGEGIYTGKQANVLLQEIANNPLRGGFNYGQMTEALVTAISALPAPVTILKELREANDRVTTFDEIASI